MKRDGQISKELRALLKKFIDGTISTEEKAYLSVMQRGFEEDEWDRLVTQVVMKAQQERTARAKKSAAKAKHQGRSKSTRPTRLSSIRHVIMHLDQAFLWTVAAVVVFSMIYQIWKYDPMMDLTYNCVQVETDGPVPLQEFTVFVGHGEERLSIRPGTTGVLMEEQGVEVIRKKSGAFEVRMRPESLLDTTTPLELQFETPVRQQAEVLLPDGSVVMLNAGSTLTYEPVSKRNRNAAILCLTGEAWIQAPLKLQIASDQGVVHAEPGSSFELLADGHQTRLKLLDGQVSMQGKERGGQVQLDKAGTELWAQTITELDGSRKQSFKRTASWTKTDVPIWARTIREYRNAPLREFVRDLARWHGYGVERLDCIDPGKIVSVAVCYQSQPNDLLAVIKGENIRVEYDHHKFTFCPDNRKTNPLPMVIQDRVSGRAGGVRWRL